MLSALGHPILQFGTSRFLQAHVDLFVSEALERGEALGGITVVQTTGNAASSRRTAALASGEGYEVRIRGLSRGRLVDTSQRCRAVRAALNANSDWAAVRAEVAGGAVQVIVSNTGDTGWALDAADTAESTSVTAPAPRGFVAKLVVLLHDRWRERPTAALTMLPCELVPRNAEALRDLVTTLAADWSIPPEFGAWVRDQVVWANSLVDRIVSEAIEPVGAIAEPYALWAIERRPGLVLPCTHPAIELTDDLTPYERLKLHLLNLGHSVLADRWLQSGAPPDMTVLQAMRDPAYREPLESVWADEVLPVFATWGLEARAIAYLEGLRDRLLNPSLAHRLADIAQNHSQKMLRRFQPIVDQASRHLPSLAQTQLRAALARR